MSDFSIGLSGIQVAQQALELTGANIANASTPGYHRQEAMIVPLGGSSMTNQVGGAQITDIRRVIDRLTENQLVRQQTLLGQVKDELATLQLVETALGTVGADKTAEALDGFFGAMRELAGQPNSQALQEQAVWAGQSLATQISNFRQFLQTIQSDIQSKAEVLVSKANELITEAADLNRRIAVAQARGAQPNTLLDRRDNCISQLADLMEIETSQAVDDGGGLRAYAWGTPVIAGGNGISLELGTDDDGKLGIGVEGSGYYLSASRGGSIGAMLSLTNDVLPDLIGKLDSLARQVIQQVNALHVQGVPPTGSFTELTGQVVESGEIGTWTDSVVNGDLYVRVTDESTGQMTRTKITVDPAADTVAEVAARIGAIAHLSANIVGGSLRIAAADGYKFDFSPALSVSPETSDITGTAAVTVSGAYGGTANQTYTVTVSTPDGTPGTVGLASGLSLQVKIMINGAFEVVRTINVGLDYVPGDILTLDEGVRIAMSAGTLGDGDSFTILALANSDTSGFLAATGINTFFVGDSAENMDVRAELLDNPRLIAGSITQSATDNLNIQRMADMAETKLGVLGDLTCSDFYQKIVTGVGEGVAARKSRQDALETMVRQLGNQRDAFSGIDINEQSALLLVYQRMFQSMSKYISVQEQTMQYLVDMI